MDELTDLNEVVEPEEENQEEIVLATVAEVTADGVKITIDGSEEAGEKEYKVNSSQLIKPGDRVKIHKNSGTYLIEYVIGSPMERYPIPPGGSSGQVLTKDGSNDFTVKWANAHGVPSGGTSGYVLAKNSGTDYDLTWAQPHWLPSGGTNGQVLAKSSAADYSVAWVDAGQGVPTGGTTGQALTKKSNTNYDLQWSDIKGIPSGGTTGQVLKKSSNTNYAVEWGAAPSPTALSNGSYTVTCASNGFLYPSSGNISLGSNNGYWYNCYIKGSMRFGDSSYSPNAIGFFGKTPVSKQTLYSSSTLANVITLLQNYGLA